MVYYNDQYRLYTCKMSLIFRPFRAHKVEPEIQNKASSIHQPGQHDYQIFLNPDMLILVKKCCRYVHQREWTSLFSCSVGYSPRYE